MALIYGVEWQLDQMIRQAHCVLTELPDLSGLRILMPFWLASVIQNLLSGAMDKANALCEE